MNTPWTRREDGVYTAKASDVYRLLLKNEQGIGLDQRAYILPNGINLMRMDKVSVSDAVNKVTDWQYRTTDEKRTLVAIMFNDRTK